MRLGTSTLRTAQEPHVKWQRRIEAKNGTQTAVDAGTVRQYKTVEIQQ